MFRSFYSHSINQCIPILLYLESFMTKALQARRTSWHGFD